MEDLHIKENLQLQNDSDAVKVLSLPASMIREPLKVFNMSASTPRKPLTDIKQVARPKDSVNIKTSTPLGTPRPTNLHRKLKPSSLLKKADKENVMTDSTRIGKSADSCSSSHRMDEIFEENVEEFVTKVLDQCVQDLKDEKTDISSKKKLGVEELKPTLTDICMLTDTQSDDLRSQPEIEVELESEQLECMTDEAARTDGRQELVSQFGDLSVNEDSLLGNSNYSDCSFTESTKSEEELLASYVQTPNLNNCSETYSNVNRKEMNSFEPLEARSLGLKFQTPQPTFLEKLALRQRVNDATSSLATWVFPKEVTEHHVQIVSGNNKIKHMHDVACSPMPQSRKKLSSNNNFYDNQNKETRNINGYDYDKQKGNSSINDHLYETKKDTLNCNFDSENVTNCEETQTNKDTNVDIELGTAKCINKSLQSNYSTPHGKVMCRDFASNTSINILPPVAMNSVACSPISVPVCDFSVQNEVETQSVLCSPIRFENCDVSIQHEAEMHSMMCSPIRFQGNDVSIQNEVEMCSVMCSPMQLQVHDVSVQNQIDTHSIMCSPMVPCPSEDKYTFTLEAEVNEMGTNTERKVWSELGLQIQPDMVTASTEMAENPMTSTSTSMTPLKMNKKKGMKLTAEDVRKQHPRVLANELETLRLENSRLENQVKAYEKDRKKLVVQKDLQVKFEENKAALREMETKYSHDIDEWQTKQQALESEISVLKLELEDKISVLKLEHENEMSVLKLEHKNKEKLAMSDSQKDIESKAEWIRQQESDFQAKNEDLLSRLKKYEADLISLEQDKLAIRREQDEMANDKITLQKERDLVFQERIVIQKEQDEIVENKLAIQIGLEQISEDKLAIQKERDEMANEKLDIQKDREQMAEIVSSCKENMLEIESKLEETTAELEATRETVLTMKEEIDTISKEKEKVTAHKEELLTQNTTLKNEVDKLEKVTAYKEELLKQNATLKNEVDKLREEINGHNATIKQLKEDIESMDNRRELIVRNLNRTLESRESEIDLLEKDLFECREIIYNQMETAKSQDTKEKSMSAELTTLKGECDRLKDCCANLRAKEQETRAILKSTQEELTGTQDYASIVMKKQGTEIADCSSAIDELLENMTGVLANLSRRAGIENKDVENSKVVIDGSTLNKEPLKDNTNISISLVSQILNAANSLGENIEDATRSNEDQEQQTRCENNEKTNKPPNPVDALSCEQGVVDSPGALSRKKLGFSGNSAFAPVKKSVTLKTAQSAGNDVTSCNSRRSSGNSLSSVEPVHKSVCHAVSNKVESKFESVCHPSEEGELSNQMSRVAMLFTEIVRVAHLIEKALKSSLNDVTFENEDLSSRVSQCEYSERRLQAELQVTQTELEKSNSMVDQLNGKLRELSDNFESMLDQEGEMKLVQEEIGRLRGKNQGLKAENELLNEQITELLEKLETAAAPGSDGRSAVDVESQRQVIALKKKVEKYRALLNEKDTMVEQMSAKAVKRIQKLESNWKKADAEVCKFDELVDTVRSVLVDNKTVQGDEQLLKLIDLIDGNEQVAAFDTERRRASLKPVKTA